MANDLINTFYPSKGYKPGLDKRSPQFGHPGRVYRTAVRAAYDTGVLPSYAQSGGVARQRQIATMSEAERSNFLAIISVAVTRANARRYGHPDPVFIEPDVIQQADGGFVADPSSPARCTEVVHCVVLAAAAMRSGIQTRASQAQANAGFAVRRPLEVAPWTQRCERKAANVLA